MHLRLSRPPRTLLPAVAATVALLAGAASAHAAGHDVAMRWKVFFSDVGGSGGPDVVDVFGARGAPFGRGRVVTRTPREQSSDLVRTPTFTIRTARGVVRGRLRVEKTYLETTARHQLARFEGTGRFDGGTRAYRGAAGRITRVAGKVDCFADGSCDGHLDLEGRVRY